MITPDSPALFDFVRRFDRERFVTVLFAPAERRDDLLALYAFNIELSRIREQAREPIAGLIRLQWWRDTILGGEGRGLHPLVDPLRATIQRRDLNPEQIDRLLILRERDFESDPPEDLTAAEQLAVAGPITLAHLALAVLGADQAANRAAATAVATAWGILGHLRALAYHRSLGRPTLPASDPSSLPEMAQILGNRAGQQLALVRQIPYQRHALPVLLPALQAEAHLAALRRANWDLLDPRLLRFRPRPWALTWAAWKGTI